VQLDGSWGHVMAGHSGTSDKRYTQERLLPRLADRRGLVLAATYMAVVILSLIYSMFLGRAVTNRVASNSYIDRMKSLHIADGALDVALAQLATDGGYVGTAGAWIDWGNGGYNITVADHPVDTSTSVVTAIGSYPSNPVANAEASQRTVSALVAKNGPLVEGGITGETSISGSAGPFVFDGYDSADGKYSGSNSGLLNTHVIGTTASSTISYSGPVTAATTDVYCGYTETPPDEDCVAPGNVGDFANINNKTSAWTTLTEYTPPTPPYVPATYWKNSGTTILNAGDPLLYQAPSDGADQYSMNVTDFYITGTARLGISSDLDRVTIYVAGPGMMMTTTKRIGNVSGDDSTQMVIQVGLGATSPTLANGEFVGILYAPGGYVDVSAPYTLYGAVAADTVNTFGAVTYLLDLAALTVGGSSGTPEVSVWLNP
jgi:hypothetical protein